MFKPLSWTFGVLLITALLAACATTTLNVSWKNPDYRGKIGKVYVIGISKNELTRRVFEDEFGTQLASRGVGTVSSYKDLKSPAEADQQTVAAHLKDSGADSVLMARVVSRHTEQVTFSSPRFESWGSYYDRRYVAIYDAPTTAEFEIVIIEASLYDAGTGRQIWSAQLETLIDPDYQKTISDFVQIVIKDLQGKDLL